MHRSTHKEKIPEDRHYSDTLLKASKGKVSNNCTKLKATGERPYRCRVCGMSFHTRTYLELHKMTHAGEKHHTCDVCGKCCSTAYHLKRHERVHSQKLKCDVCLKKFSRADHLRNHMPLPSKDKPHKCSLCPKSFPAMFMLKHHQSKVHASKKESYKCNLCDLSFKKSWRLRKHKRFIHSEKALLACDKCDFSSFDSRNFRRHVSNHTGSKQYTCDVCDYSTAGAYVTQWHMSHHHTKSTACHETHNGSSDAHDGKRAGAAAVDSHLCDVCAQVFTTIFALRKHQERVHGNPTRLLCEYCAKAFKCAATLRKHCLTHTKQLPVACQLCAKSFANSLRLDAHVRSQHKGKVVYSCSSCGYKSLNFWLVKKHLQKHTPVNGSLDVK